MSEKFKREGRYLVLKNTDVAKYLTEDQQIQLGALATKVAVGRLKAGKPDHNYVVVADDWPEYETVRAMIEARVTEKPSELETLRAIVRAAAENGNGMK